MLCWACRIPEKNARLESAIEASRGEYFRASVVVILPGGEVLAADIGERGKKHVYAGRNGEVLAKGGALWDLVDVMRKADGHKEGRGMGAPSTTRKVDSHAG